MSKQREAFELALEALEKHGNSCLNHEDAYSAAINAIREALAEPEPEPVAVVTSQTGDPSITMSWHHEPALPIGTKLYTTPPTRKPLSYMEACTFIAFNIENGAESLEMQSQLVDLIRAVERAHGIKPTEENT